MGKVEERWQRAIIVGCTDEAPDVVPWLASYGMTSECVVSLPEARMAAVAHPAVVAVADVRACLDARHACDELFGLAAVVAVGQHDARGRAVALEAGARDCLSRPFDARELALRVRAVARRERAHVLAEAALRAREPLMPDVATLEALRLSSRERGILEALLSRRGTSVSVGDIYRQVWGAPVRPGAKNLVAVYVSRLRAKLIDAFGRDVIETQRNGGYRLMG